VYDTRPVRLFQRIADLHAALERLLQRHRPFLKPRFQSFALDILHNQVVGSILATDVVQHANMRMIQRRNGAGFPLETLFGLGIIRQMNGKDFDGDGAVEARVCRAIDFSHASGAQRGNDFVGAEFRASGEGHGCAPL
jgi:hypothetical protein